ncbi:outer membrane efflux protein [Clostridium puniceum]|uniref:Outer membrane efflux protein n=1 Tax=Clostridium puniceum TaxID=29367 RepID=A0A1S8TCS6_9CLOT|nr:TolC family protein [Clostridium puniceum]OOM75600.1 outer membrane efflux protein [Clostridium puniceum]
MRKNINKLIAFAIGISVISGNAITAFGEEDVQNNTTTINETTADTTNTGVIYVQNQVKKDQVTQKPVLTLQESIDAAINNSDKLALKSKEIKLYEDKLDIQDELDDIQDNDDNDFPYDKLELTVDQTKEQKDYMEDQIAQDITNKYNDLITRNNEIDQIKKQLEIKTIENGYVKLKKDLGLATEIEIKNADVEFQKLKNSEKAKEDQLKNAQDYFKILTEKDLNNYSLQEEQEFEAFKINKSQDEYFDNVIDKYYKYDKKIFELTKDNLDDNKVHRPSSSDKPDKDDFKSSDENGNQVFDSEGYAKAEREYENSFTDYGTYLQNKYNLSSSKVSLEENKKNLKKGLKESYAKLIDMENSINVAKSNIEVKNNELSIAKLKYDQGLITKIAYDKQVIDNDTLETDLRTSINDYNTLKNQIQKPWLLS